MSNKKQVLGRGLSAILGDNSDKSEKNIEYKPRIDNTDLADKNELLSVKLIAVSKIQTNPYQPRTSFNNDALDELAESIRHLGVIQPLTLRKAENPGIYQIISGERRFRASQMAGLDEVPAYIREANDKEMLEMALVENIQREDLDPIEEAMTYSRLIEEFNLTQEAMSTRVGKKRSTVTNYLRLLNLDPIIQYGIRDKMLTMGHARALLSLENNEQQVDVYEKVIHKDLSVRQVEKIVKEIKEGKSSIEKIDNSKDMDDKWKNTYEKKFLKLFSLPVKIDQKKDGKGKMIISFSSKEDVESIEELLKKN